MSDPYRVNRRRFFSTAAGTTLMLPSQSPAARSPLAAERDLWPKLRPARIYKIFIGRSGPRQTADGKTVQYLTWGQEEIARFNNYLQELENKLGNVTFLGGEAIPPADVAQVAANAASADALLIVWLSGHGGDYEVLDKLNFGLDKPAVSFFQPFSGHGWMWHQQWQKRKVVFLSTSDWRQLEEAIKVLRVPALMKQTRIMAINGPRGTKAACSADLIKQKLGAEMVTVPREKLMELANSIDPKAAQAEAEHYWISQADAIVEPTRQEIIDSARFYLATRQFMIQENFRALSYAGCMGDPRGCLTISKLGDLGLVGACEGSMDDTLTMLLFAYAFGEPGFSSDPVIDEAKNAMIHFHCTSFTLRPDGRRMPFVIRSQTDSGGGVALQVQWQIGEPVTTAKLVNLDTMLVVPGKIIETGSSRLACRTQFTQTVRNARHLYLNWGGRAIVPADFVGDIATYIGAMPMLHRSVFYGDHLRGVKYLGSLMGFRVIEEDLPA